MKTDVKRILNLNRFIITNGLDIDLLTYQIKKILSERNKKQSHRDEKILSK